MDGERGTKISHQIYPDEEIGFRKVHQELVTTLGADTNGRFQIKI
jgi:hypothetical protein